MRKSSMAQMPMPSISFSGARGGKTALAQSIIDRALAAGTPCFRSLIPARIDTPIRAAESLWARDLFLRSANPAVMHSTSIGLPCFRDHSEARAWQASLQAGPCSVLCVVDGRVCRYELNAHGSMWWNGPHWPYAGETAMEAE